MGIIHSNDQSRDGALASERDQATGVATLVVWVWAAATLAAVATLLVRGLEPALPGIWYGMDHLINGLKLVNAALSQLLAVGGGGLLVLLAARVVRSELSAGLRAFSVGVTMMVLLALLITTGFLAGALGALLDTRLSSRLPTESGIVLGTAVATVSVMVASARARVAALRAPALVLGVMAVAALVRMVGIGLGHYAVLTDLAALYRAARVVATVAVGIEVLALTLAVTWILTQPVAWRRAGGRSRRAIAVGPVRVAVLVAAVLAGGALAQRGLRLDARGLAVLVARAVQELVVSPPPLLPLVAHAVVEALSWAMVVVLLLLRPQGAAVSAAVTLALVGRASLDTPLGALATALGALTLALAQPRRRASVPGSAAAV